MPEFSLNHWHQKSCAFCLSNEDADFIQKITSQEFSDPQTRRTILDHPSIAQTILEFPNNLQISPELFFYTLIRKSLLDIDIDNYPLTDYLVYLLSSRLTTKRSFNNPINQGKTSFYISDCLIQINQATDEDQFYLRVSLANQSLFLTGLFEEHIRHRTERRGAPNLEFIQEVGSNQYRIAHEHKLAEELLLGDVFQTLAVSFPLIRKVLSHISQDLLHLGDPFFTDEL